MLGTISALDALSLYGGAWTVMNLVWLLAEVRHMRALRMSHCFTPVSPLPLAPAVWLVGFVCCLFWGVWFLLFVFACHLVLQVSGGF